MINWSFGSQGGGAGESARGARAAAGARGVAGAARTRGGGVASAQLRAKAGGQ